MSLPPSTLFHFNPESPIPNGPFYSPQTNALQSLAGPLIVGSGININYTTSVISTSGGGGSGTVTSVATGAGLTGGPITSSGTISLTNTTVTPDTYNYSTITVDAQGRLTGASSGTVPVTAVTGTAPIAVTAGATPVVSIAASSTTGSGAVQLYNGTNSLSTSLALTAAQGKNLQDQITALLTTPNVDLAGTLNASTGFVDSVTSVGSTAGYTVGSVLPAAALATVDTYVVVTDPGTVTPPGGVATVATKGDWFLVSETSPGVYAWQFLNVGFDALAATTTVAGIVCLSTNALAQAGVDTTTALTPAAAASAYIPRGCITGKGALITGTAVSTPATLTVGTDGQALIACSTAPNGICWGTVPGATPTVAGIVLGCTTPTNATLGCNTGKSFTTGVQNSLVGAVAGCAVTSGSANTALGHAALASATTTCLNTVVGNAAGSQTTGGFNTYIGAIAGCSMTTGNCNVIIGYGVNHTNLAASCQLAIGFGPGCCWLLGFDNRSIQPAAGIVDCTGSTGSSGQALFSNGANAVCWGPGATQATPISFGTVKGCVTADNTALGCNALCAVTTGTNNVMLGDSAGCNISTGSRNVIIGSGVPAPGSGDCQLAIGAGSGLCWVVGYANLSVQFPRGVTDCTGSRGCLGRVLTAVDATGGGLCWTDACATPICRGFVLGCTDANNAALGCNALKNNTGVSNVAIGFNASCTSTGGSGNVAVGFNALCSNLAGSNNVFIGNSAGKVSTSSNSVGIGACALICSGGAGDNVAIGSSAASANVLGTSITAIGTNALNSTTCGLNTALGVSAGSNVTTGSQNVIIGPNAAAPVATGSCQLALGFSATDNWLTGCSDKSIRPGAGIRDCCGCVGTKGQVLTATGCALGSSVEWRNLPGCPVIRRSSQTSTFGAAFTPITICYGTAITDTTGWYNGATGAFQPNIAGYYQINAMARAVTLTTGVGESVVSIVCNGTNIVNVGSYGLVNGTVSTLVCMNGTTDALCIQISAGPSGTGCTVTQPSTSRFTSLLMALA